MLQTSFRSAAPSPRHCFNRKAKAANDSNVKRDESEANHCDRKQGVARRRLDQIGVADSILSAGVLTVVAAEKD